jgi:hypothetical protein
LIPNCGGEKVSGASGHPPRGITDVPDGKSEVRRESWRGGKFATFPGLPKVETAPGNWVAPWFLNAPLPALAFPSLNCARVSAVGRGIVRVHAEVGLKG